MPANSKIIVARVAGVALLIFLLHRHNSGLQPCVCVGRDPVTSGVSETDLNKSLPKSKTLRNKESTGEKADCEMKYWLSRLEKEGYDKMVQYRADEYHAMSTNWFGLSDSFYQDKRVADIGPGPRGSLEWADMTKLRVGIDPIANMYMRLGVSKQKMSYVSAAASDIPFPDGYFDVVQTMNSLDHVADIHSAIKEIQRVIKPGGLLLLMVDVNHDPTPCEPTSFGWDIVDEFTELKLLEDGKYEKYAPQSVLYQKLLKEGRIPEVHNSSQPYDFSNPAKRYGTLRAKFQKVPA